jgi:hypothetical protein
MSKECELRCEHEANMRYVRGLRERGWGVSRNFAGNVFYDEFGHIIGTTTMGIPRTRYTDFLERERHQPQPLEITGYIPQREESEPQPTGIRTFFHKMCKYVGLS